jgi:hypothetical protein
MSASQSFFLFKLFNVHSHLVITIRITWNGIDVNRRRGFHRCCIGPTDGIDPSCAANVAYGSFAAEAGKAS